jgi:hypothetical protein
MPARVSTKAPSHRYERIMPLWEGLARADRQSYGRGLPSRPQREVAPDPARLERAATLTNCGLGAPLPDGCALGGFAFDLTPDGRRQIGSYVRPHERLHRIRSPGQSYSGNASLHGLALSRRRPRRLRSGLLVIEQRRAADHDRGLSFPAASDRSRCYASHDRCLSHVGAQRLPDELQRPCGRARTGARPDRGDQRTGLSILARRQLTRSVCACDRGDGATAPKPGGRTRALADLYFGGSLRGGSGVVH